MKANETLREKDSGNVPLRILVVEDDVDTRQLTVEVLASFGYHVDAAEDGAAGWEALQAGRYDLLITDNNMPRVSGVELVQQLRAARMTLPVVLASSTIPAEALDRNQSLQLAATLLKPFTIAELLATVKQALRPSEPVTSGPSRWVAEEANCQPMVHASENSSHGLARSARLRSDTVSRSDT